MHKPFFQITHHHSSNAIYGLGFLGAAVYYFQHAQSFSEGLFGLLKAILWPAFMIYRVIEVLHI